MKNSTVLFFVILMALLVASCDRATGGGKLEGVNGRASFGFTGDGCDTTNFKGQFQYNDQDGGQKLHGDVVFARQCLVDGDCPVCDPLRIQLGFPLTLGDYEVTVDYRSTNNASPGTGTATVCFTDNGEGAKAVDSDSAIISISSGPYAGYLNHGSIQGNVQQHKCN